MATIALAIGWGIRSISTWIDSAMDRCAGRAASSTSPRVRGEVGEVERVTPPRAPMQAENVRRLSHRPGRQPVGRVPEDPFELRRAGEGGMHAFAQSR